MANKLNISMIEQPSDYASESDFIKAVEENKWVVFGQESLDQFDSDLEKAIREAEVSGVSAGERDIIVKAMRDRSKLVKKTIVDKNGKTTTKWVKPAEGKKDDTVESRGDKFLRENMDRIEAKKNERKVADTSDWSATPTGKSIMDAYAMSSNEYNDPSKMKMTKTSNGNWALEYDGKDVSVWHGAGASDEFVKENGLEASPYEPAPKPLGKVSPTVLAAAKAKLDHYTKVQRMSKQKAVEKVGRRYGQQYANAISDNTSPSTRVDDTNTLPTLIDNYSESAADGKKRKAQLSAITGQLDDMLNAAQDSLVGAGYSDKHKHHGSMRAAFGKAKSIVKTVVESGSVDGIGIKARMNIDAKHIGNSISQGHGAVLTVNFKVNDVVDKFRSEYQAMVADEKSQPRHMRTTLTEFTSEKIEGLIEGSVNQSGVTLLGGVNKGESNDNHWAGGIQIKIVA